MTATPSGPEMTAGRSRELNGLANAFARHLAAGGVGPGDRVAVMTSNRPEFVVAVHAIAKVGAAAVLREPGLEGGRGGPRGRAHRAGAGPSPTAPAPSSWPGCWAPTGSPISTTPPPSPPILGGATDPLPCSRRRPRDDEARAGVQLRHHRPPQGRAPHPPLDGPRHPALGGGARPRARRPLPGRHPAVAHPRPAQPADRGRGRRLGAPPPPLRPRRSCSGTSRRSG